MIFLSAVLRQPLSAPGKALGSRIGPLGPTAQRPEVLDADTARRILVRAETGVCRVRRSGSAGEGGAVPAEGEHGQCDQRLG